MTNLIKAEQIVWEIPEETEEVLVEVFAADNTFVASYTITNYITLKGGQKLRVTAKK